MSVRIAIVAHHALGGSGVMAVEWADLLARRGHDVSLMRFGAHERDHIFASSDPSHAPTLYRVEAPSHPVLSSPSELCALVSTIAAEHTRAPFDIVHVHYSLPFALLAPLLATLPRRPAVVVSLHGSDVTGIGAAPEYGPALRLALQQADAITTPGPWLREQCIAGGLASADSMFALPNFVALDRFIARESGADRPLVRSAFGDDDGTPVVLHLSNFRAVKRVEDVVDTVAAMASLHPRLVFVGDGPERERIFSQASHVLGNRCAAVGAIADPAAWLREADVMLLPSESESFGLAALEALASGTPVVTSNAGGLRDWLKESDASTQCDVGDVSAFAAGATRLLTGSDEATRRRSARALAVAAGHPDRAAAIAEELYSNLINRRRLL